MEERRRHGCLGWLLVPAVLLTALTGLEAQAQVDVLDRIETVPGQGETELHIFLNAPFGYETHVPRQSGDTLRVELRNVTMALATRPDLQGRQILSWERSKTVPLVEVWYEYAPPESPHLVLYFSRPVSFRVRSAPDLRSIIVIITGQPDRSGETQVEGPPRGETSSEPPADAPKPVPASPSEAGPVSLEPRRPLEEDYSPATADSLALPYAINLRSTQKPVDLGEAPDLGTADQYMLYTTQAELDGEIWHRLRLGFFPTREAAEAVRTQLLDRFPGAWVATATREERNEAARQATASRTRVEPAPTTAAPTGSAASPYPPSPASNLPPISDERLKKLMEEAQQAMTAGEYRRAIPLYTKVLQYPDNPYGQDALEFLGLARERNGQLAHAKAEYTRYLELYPEGEGTDRVHQRLQGLITARDQPKEELRKTQTAADQVVWTVYGGFSQIYRHDWSKVGSEEEASVDNSRLDSNLDITARRVSARRDVRVRYSGAYLNDFLKPERDGDRRLSAAYIHVADKGWKLSTRLGRQSRNTGGVLGRFDGGLLSYRMAPWIQVNGVAGYPVQSTTQLLETDRHFYGISFDLGTFAKSLDFIPYLIEQQAGGITDRRAVGMETRFFRPNGSVVSLIDYDVFFEDVNTALLLLNWKFPARVTLTTTADYRKSPVLTTSNALQGQAVESIEELKKIFSDREIYELAEDRTYASRTFNLGLSRPLTPRIQLTGDVTMTRLSSTPASGGVEGTPDTGNEYFYSAQVIGNSLIKQGDITILGLRHASTSSAETSSFNLDTRYPINRAWRLNPKFRVSYRESHDGAQQITLAPLLRTTYTLRRRRRTTFEIDTGAEFSLRDGADDTNDSSAYYVSLAYRVDF